MDKYLLGYSLSVVAALPVTFLWSWLLHKLVAKHKTAEDTQAERVLWIPLLMGVFERAIITTLVGWQVPGTAGFIGAWVAVKSAGGWSSWSKGTTYGRAVFFTGLLGSAMSILFAVFGGLIIAQ
jgi:hypothetical protein